MLSAWDKAFEIVLGHEGGFTANPRDPGNWTGGAIGVGICRGTNFGISAAAYPDIDIASITKEQAKAIYKRDYWNKINGDNLPAPLALILYDFGVNSGPATAAKALQRVLGVTQDGVIGPQTLKAVQAKQGQGVDIIVDILARRALFMMSLKIWNTFGFGWLRRLFRLAIQAINMRAS